jgi:hypothetical protein
MSEFWNSLSSQSGTLAAWITAIATVFLVVGVVFAWRSMVISARSSAFQTMSGRFDAPNMRYARAVCAKTYLERKAQGVLGQIKNRYVPGQGWLIINFLNQLGHLVQKRRIGFRDVELAYSEYIMVIGGLWGQQLDEYFRDSRYAPFLKLYKKIKASPLPKSVKNDLDLYFDQDFWLAEASLDQSAESEEPLGIATIEG